MGRMAAILCLVVASLIGAQSVVSQEASIRNSPAEQSFRPWTAVGFSLKAPRYDNTPDIARHAAFSRILARLLDDTFREVPQACILKLSSISFPDLRLLLEVAGSSGRGFLKGCLEKIEDILKRRHFDESAFRAAAREAAQAYRIVQLETGNVSGLGKASRWPSRVRLVAEHALRRLYSDDPALHPLLSGDQLAAESNNYDAFLAWLADQRSANQLGFFPINASEAEELARWGFALSVQSIRPIPRPLNIGRFGKLHVRANIGARSVVLVRCNTALGRDCSQQLRRLFCSKTEKQIRADTPTKSDSSSSEFKCMTIDVFSLPGWIAAESDDEHAVRWLAEELVAQRLGATELVEYVVLVTTE
jgi:hypothetical protein